MSRFNTAVVTIMSWDRYACELCDAPIQPTQCPLLPRELCRALVSMVEGDFRTCSSVCFSELLNTILISLQFLYFSPMQ